MVCRIPLGTMSTETIPPPVIATMEVSVPYCAMLIFVNTFPTWHRPYVALYEQLLGAQFPAIIRAYAAANPSLGAQLSNSAQIWRLPYWDWGQNADIPDEWSGTTINIWATDGSVTAVPNPLNNYAFHPIDSSFRGSRYQVWPTTLRQPDSTNSRAQSQPDVANQQLAATDFKQLILDLFPATLFQPDPWGQFSNHTWTDIHPGQGELTSLESIHDGVHVDVGGSGHMGDPAVAAFDPIFWLHHCNVDRLLALWQAVYPNTYVSPGPDLFGTKAPPLRPLLMKGTFVHRPDRNPGATDINANTPLEPFWKSQSAFATSNDAISTRTYGYTYPEIAAAGPVFGPQLSQAVMQIVQQLYGGGSIFSAFTVQKDQSEVAMEALRQGIEKATIKPVVKENAIHIPAHAAFTAVPEAQRVLNPPSGTPQARAVAPNPPKPIPEPKPSDPQGGAVPPPQSTPQSHPSGPQGGAVQPANHDYVVTPDNYRDWIANVTLEKYALGGSGRVAFFLGPEDEIPTDPTEWLACPIYVGSFSIFATNPETTGCKNCKDQAEKQLRVGGTVHLTKALIRRRCPLTGDPPVQYLAEYLHWRICDVHGNHIPRENVPSLKVVVQSAGYVDRPGLIGRRPERAPWTRHSPATRGKLGGVTHGHEF